MAIDKKHRTVFDSLRSAVEINEIRTRLLEDFLEMPDPPKMEDVPEVFQKIGLQAIST